MNQQTQSRSVWINEDGLNKIREKMAILQKPEDSNKNGKRSWTINYLANQSYVSESVVKRLLNKKIPIDRNNAISILKILEFEPFQFITEHDRKLSNQNLEENIMIDWRLICQEMLKEQQEERRFRKRATEQGFEVKVFLPLGLTKRKQQQRRDSSKFDNTKDPYQLEEEVIERIYKHDDFLHDVIEQKTTSQAKYLAIIGEPGAGKSTWLDSIATHIQENTENLAICISLANLQGKTVKQYLLEEWLPEAIPLIYPNADVDESHEKSLQKRLQQGRVWLLLDGVDEIKETTSSYILDDIQQQLTGYLSKVRVILTCRTNVWDVKVNNGMTGFDTYKTQEFSPSDIRIFIKQWFGFARQPKQGKILRKKLDESQYSNIKNLIKNPLRLSLFCQVHGKDEKIEFPKTKAELYQNFVNYFYDWKPNQTNIDWSTQLKLKDDLHRSLGKLSIAGLDSPTQFRLPLSLIKKYMKDKLFKLAWDLGWLNLVDRCSINDEPVYAFFHPSFQEYFAVLAINNLTFFLNHNNDYPNPFQPFNNESCNYRIFKNEWQEVIKMWVEKWLLKHDVSDQEKDKFMSSIINFNDGCHNLFSRIFLYKLSDYGRQLYNSEFNKIRNFDDYDGSFDMLFYDEWLKYERCTSLFPEGVGCGYKFYNQVSSNLGLWIHQYNSCKVYHDNKKILNEIHFSETQTKKSFKSDKKKRDEKLKDMVKYLIELNFENDNKNYEDKFIKIKEINIKNKDEVDLILHSYNIDFLSVYLDTDSTPFFRGLSIQRLIYLVSVDSEKALKLSRKANTNKEIMLLSIIWILGEATKRSQQEDLYNIIINILCELSPKTSGLSRYLVLFFLSAIILQNKTCLIDTTLIVKALKYIYYANKNNNVEKFCYWVCEGLLIKISQKMSYPEFYKEWHNQLEIIPPEILEISPLGNTAIAQTLNRQILDLPSQLKPTEKTYLLVINAKSLEKITNENSLSQALCNKIYKLIFPQKLEIPQIKHPPDLESEIRKIKDQLQKENLALVFYQGEPSEILINVCDQLAVEIYFKFISNQLLEQAIPPQENLVNILQNWINELD